MAENLYQCHCPRLTHTITANTDSKVITSSIVSLIEASTIQTMQKKQVQQITARSSFIPTPPAQA
jgi:hypothetical protein